MLLAAPKTDMSFTAKPLSILFVPTRKLYRVTHTKIIRRMAVVPCRRNGSWLSLRK